jgi:hypothetical protein
MAVRDELNAELAGGDRQLEALAATADGKLQGNDPSALPAHARRVHLNRSPQRHRARDKLPGRRCSERDLTVPRVHAAGAVGIRCTATAGGRVEDVGTTSCLQFGSIPAVVGPHRLQRAIAQAPLPEADDRSDEVGGREWLGAHGAGTGSGTSSGCSLGSTSGGDAGGAGCGGAGTVSGSTVMRRDGPGIDARARAPANTTTIE